MAGSHVDLLVVGGGIVGCAIAWLAARAGVQVALVERGDLAGATSSASSKLIHGGLRYLQMGDIGLVREAHAERHALARIVAPHLVRPRAFLVPVYRGGPVRASTLRAGFVLYGGLGRFADGAIRWNDEVQEQGVVLLPVRAEKDAECHPGPLKSRLRSRSGLRPYSRHPLP